MEWVEGRETQQSYIFLVHCVVATRPDTHARRVSQIYHGALVGRALDARVGRPSYIVMCVLPRCIIRRHRRTHRAGTVGEETLSSMPPRF